MKWFSLLMLMCVGCGESSSNGPDDPVPDAGSGMGDIDARVATGPYGGDREPEVFLPSGHNLDQSWPMVLVLHGYTATSGVIESYLGVGARANALGAVVVVPNGTTDQNGFQFWNASEACCDFYDTNVDDLGYLRDLIEDGAVRFGIDVKRVVVMGHSNGGFMAYRLACDASDVVSGIVSIAGLTQNSPTRCTSGDPVRVLQVHGTSDSTIPFAGNSTTPGALETTRRWRVRNGCDESTVSEASRDTVSNIAGPETEVATSANCVAGGDVELWTIQGGPHSPSFASDFTDQALEFHGLAAP